MRTRLFAILVSGLFILTPVAAHASGNDAAQTGKTGKTETVQATAIDPVCGMDVKTGKAKNVYKYKGKTYYFCSKEDMEKFKADPRKYLKK